MHLEHIRAGAGEPLLLVHGLGGTLATWEPLIEPLAAEREVVAVDMPGFGGSDPLPEGTEPSAANLAAALTAFCAAIGFERPHVAGNSLGAWVGLEMGRAREASSVTCVSPAGLWRRPLGPRRVDVRRTAALLRPLVGAALGTAAGRRRIMGSTMAYPERIPGATARRIVLGWIDSKGYEDANREMRSHVFEPAGFPEDVPVTIAWGELDRLVAPPRRERMPAGARYLVLEGCGHTPSWDDPKQVTRVLLEGSSVGTRV